jgi:hypothetical protein
MMGKNHVSTHKKNGHWCGISAVYLVVDHGYDPPTAENVAAQVLKLLTRTGN